MKKPSIPSTQMMTGAEAQLFSALKENIEVLTGARGGELKTLNANATLPQVIAKVNEIIKRLNASGN